MKTIRTRIFNNDPDLSEKEIKEAVTVANNFHTTEGKFLLEPVITNLYQPIVWGEWDGTMHRVSKEWFKETYSRQVVGFDLVVAIYSKEQSYEGGRNPEGKKNTLNGQSIDKNYGVGEIIIFHDKTRKKRINGKLVSHLAYLLVHEPGHSWPDHLLERPAFDLVHYFQDKVRDLPRFFKFISPLIALWKRPPVFQRDLEYGDQGEDVEILQDFLRREGFYPEVVESTGRYFSVTEYAVAKFQCAHEIVCDGNAETTGLGRFGPKTRAKANELIWKK